MNKTNDLQRYVTAQNAQYESVLKELRNEFKRGHWMWYIFPQIVGLGRSATSQLYAIKSLDEAQAYYDHPVLGPRLIECTRLVNNATGRTTREMFGYTDNLKLRSSMTLFSHVTSDDVFETALAIHFAGGADQLTIKILNSL